MSQERKVFHQKGAWGEPFRDSLHREVDDFDDGISALCDLDTVDYLQYTGPERAVQATTGVDRNQVDN